jgi:signal peptidase I
LGTADNSKELGKLPAKKTAPKIAPKYPSATPEPAAAPKPVSLPDPAKPKETTPEFIASIAAVLVTGLFIITFVLQAFVIPSSSMENTLLIGDHVFVDRMMLAPKSRWASWLLPYRHPKHDDIFVFVSPAEPGLYVVKRVVGVPGDRIKLQDGVVYRNGERLSPPFVVRNGTYNGYRDNFPTGPPSDYDGTTPAWRDALPSHIVNGELVVPPDSIFAMGDNRDVSLDSRYWGFVPYENVIGRPMFLYWSFQQPRDEYTRTSIAERLQFLGTIVIHFFDQTRWSRMFHVVR